MGQRLIDYIKSQGFSHKWAEQLLDNQKVRVNQKIIIDQNFMITNVDQILIDQNKTWVSRGALKLIAAIEKFHLQFDEKVVLDIGSSTGGFTEVSLRYGAKKVYALDVGTNQLAYKLRINPRVVVYEKTHLKMIRPELFKEAIAIAVVDVSFISLMYVFQALAKIAHDDMELVVLIKPQFEANKVQVAKGGFVDVIYHQDIIVRIHKWAATHHWKLIAISESPITGLQSKNIEYIAYYKMNKKKRGNNESERFSAT